MTSSCNLRKTTDRQPHDKNIRSVDVVPLALARSAALDMVREKMAASGVAVTHEGPISVGTVGSEDQMSKMVDTELFSRTWKGPAGDVSVPSDRAGAVRKTLGMGWGPWSKSSQVKSNCQVKPARS